MIVLNFDRAGAKALVIGASKDFSNQALPGLSLNAQIVFGRDATPAETGAALPQNTEYDLTLDYRFGAERWPAVARPLWLRLRAAYVDHGVLGHITDYQVIVNYPYDW